LIDYIYGISVGPTKLRSFGLTTRPLVADQEIL